MYIYTAIVSKGADGGQLDGPWMSMRTSTMVRRATTFAPELIAVSITASAPPLLHSLSFSLALYLYLSPARPHRSAPHRIAISAVTHDVVDTLNQR